jgi:flagellar secretion chaperone FliS
MWNNAHDAYFESRILAADPIELVRLLYQAATAEVREARRHLASGDIAARSKSISKACAIVLELAGALDGERGGEISRRLAELYEYIHRRLVEANFEQSDPPLAEVLSLLATLSEAWDGVKTQQEPAAGPANPWARPPAGEDAAAVHSGWSL